MKLSNKIFQVLAALLLSISIVSSVSIYASNCPKYKDKIDIKQKGSNIKTKDIIKILQNKKEKIMSIQKDGKISKEKADKIINRLDAKIKFINELENLPLDKKKEKLATNFKDRIDKMVVKGRITKAKAEDLTKNFNKKLETWNGEGYIWLHHKGFKHHCKEAR